MTDKYRLYLSDLGHLLRGEARSAKRKRDSYRSGSERDFHAGRLMAYHEVISLMLCQEEAFQIPAEELNLEDIDPEKDLI